MTNSNSHFTPLTSAFWRLNLFSATRFKCVRRQEVKTTVTEVGKLISTKIKVFPHCQLIFSLLSRFSLIHQNNLNIAAYEWRTSNMMATFIKWQNLFLTVQKYFIVYVPGTMQITFTAPDIIKSSFPWAKMTSYAKPLLKWLTAQQKTKQLLLYLSAALHMWTLETF